MATNEGEVYLKLIGDFDPDVVTKEIGIEPSRTKRKGHPRPKYDSWQYSHGKVVADFIDVYEMSAKLITVLQPKDSIRGSLRLTQSPKRSRNMVLWLEAHSARRWPIRCKARSRAPTRNAKNSTGTWLCTRQIEIPGNQWKMCWRGFSSAYELASSCPPRGGFHRCSRRHARQSRPAMLEAKNITSRAGDRKPANADCAVYLKR